MAAAIVEQERQAAAKEVAQREKRVKMQADMAAVRILHVCPLATGEGATPGAPCRAWHVMQEVACTCLPGQQYPLLYRLAPGIPCMATVHGNAGMTCPLVC